MHIRACLIVKNEAAVIGRCLNSLVGKVDSVFIIDTGSTDETLKILETPPLLTTVIQRPWVNFGHNRSELLRLAKDGADYLLLIDADQTLEGELPKTLDLDGYAVLQRHGTLEYENLRIVRADLPWFYEGATHEVIRCEKETTTLFLPGVVVVEHADSSRRAKGDKFIDDIKLLEAELRQNPDNTRAMFYLACTYHDSGAKEYAIDRFHKRTQMKGGYYQEVFYSFYRLGLLTGDVTFLYRAMEICPERWEPIHAACMILNRSGLYRASYALSKSVINWTVLNPSGLFVGRDVYDYLLAFEHSISAYYVGAFAEARDISHRLLSRADVPVNIVSAIVRNMEFLKGKVA